MESRRGARERREREIQEFDFAWVRESLTKKWGVDLASDSPQSMTVLHRCLFDPNGVSGGRGFWGLVT